MVKADIVNDVGSAAGITRVKAEKAVEVVIDGLKDGMVKGGRIELRGFGVFIVKPRKRGIGRNPRTGVVVPILPGRTVRFKPGKALGVGCSLGHRGLGSQASKALRDLGLLKGSSQ